VGCERLKNKWQDGEFENQGQYYPSDGEEETGDKNTDIREKEDGK